MSSERFVVLGLSGARSSWFGDVSRWSTSGALPVEFVKCLTAAEVRARLASGRPHSALLADRDLLGREPSLVEACDDEGCAVLSVGPPDAPPPPRVFGLLEPLGRDALLRALTSAARPVGAPTELPGSTSPPPLPGRSGGSLVVVTGPGGTGASTAAVGVAQGLAAGAGAGEVLLADLALAADQATLHDATDVVPGLPELAELARSRRPDEAEIVALTMPVPSRGYRLLLGLRRQREWASLRPRAVAAALDAVLSTFPVVVADVDPDLEGERTTGSIEVEERNQLARSAADRADVVLVVGRSGMQGTHALLRVLRGWLDHGVAPSHLQPLVNGADRDPRARAELNRALSTLLGDVEVAPPAFLPCRRGIDGLHRDVAPLPGTLERALVRTVTAGLERSRRAAAGAVSPAVVEPGTLGHWSEEAAQA